MSYNIDNIEIRGSSLTITEVNWRKWQARRDDLPEGNLPIEYFEEGMFENGKAPITDKFWWFGEFSGTSFHNGTFAEFVADLEGSADLILFWEGGDTVEGVKIRDGKAYLAPAILTLGEPEVKPLGADTRRR
jgi:hypothetical protein